jgi:large subunit ribosomal protein L9
MEVILLTKVANLGNIGDRVKVKSGFGRNYLLPEGKATLATPVNVKKFEERRAELEKIAREQLQSAEERQAVLKDYKLVIRAKAGTEGKLFGSVGTADIAEAFSALDAPVKKLEVRLPNGAIRQTGVYEISLHLHPEVNVDVKVEVVGEE